LSSDANRKTSDMTLKENHGNNGMWPSSTSILISGVQLIWRCGMIIYLRKFL